MSANNSAKTVNFHYVYVYLSLSMWLKPSVSRLSDNRRALCHSRPDAFQASNQ